jgi:hypothetical protein
MFVFVINFKVPSCPIYLPKAHAMMRIRTAWWHAICQGAGDAPVSLLPFLALCSRKHVVRMCAHTLLCVCLGASVARVGCGRLLLRQHVCVRRWAGQGGGSVLGELVNWPGEITVLRIILYCTLLYMPHYC